MAGITRKIEDDKIKLPDGRMHYQALGKGPALVLLHSMASSIWSWSTVLEPLAEKHSVYALDTMGQGDSDKPSRDYSIADYANSVVDFMKAKGINKATLIGNSVGAVIAVQMAAANPAIVDKMVLVGCPCRETEEERQQARLTMKTQYDEKGIPLPRSLDDLKLSYAHATPKLQAQVNEDRAKAGVWAWKCAVANNSFDIASALKKVKSTTLLVFGEKDMLRSKEKALQNYLKGSKLVIIPDAGHLPQVDNPKVFLEAVLPFLG